MKRFLACLATLACAMAASSGAFADPASQASPTPPAGAPPAAATAPAVAKPPAQAAKPADPIGDVINAVLSGSLPGAADYFLKATLYHAGARGIRALDSLGCKVVAMRTAAVDGVKVPRHTVLFIKETVGLPMPDGSKHDGYWYASDVGGGIHAGRIDLFTGKGAASMAPLMPLNLATLTVVKAGVFQGCPPG
ncbi:MAG TPA: 3D domain-containing protein [Caulobacteraceae bacterium]